MNDLQQRYVAFRTDAANIGIHDCAFATENQISIDQVAELKTPEVIRAINAVSIKDQLPNLLEQVLKYAYERLLDGTLTIKSFESLAAILPSLLKHHQLDSGKPTEIVEYKDLRDKSLNELHSILMGELRNGRN